MTGRAGRVAGTGAGDAIARMPPTTPQPGVGTANARRLVAHNSEDAALTCARPCRRDRSLTPGVVAGPGRRDPRRLRTRPRRPGGPRPADRAHRRRRGARAP